MKELQDVVNEIFQENLPKLVTFVTDEFIDMVLDKVFSRLNLPLSEELDFDTIKTSVKQEINAAIGTNLNVG